MAANTGYGICGAFNVYSSSAKLGNWVEDEAGQALAANPRPAIGVYLTNTAANHIDPKDMVAHPSMTQVKMLSTAELKAKNKEGTSYSMLFDHGKPVPADVRYRTAHRDNFFGRTKDKADEAFARQDSDLAKAKAKQVCREIRAGYDMAPNSKMANAYSTNNNQYYTPNRIEGRQERMPNWKRKSILMQTE